MANILPNDTNLAYPGGPYNGAIGNGGCWSVASGGSSATCFCPTYFEVWLDLPAGGGNATLNFTTITDPNVNTSLTVVVDGGVATTTAIATLSSLSLFTGLAAGVHQVKVGIDECSYKAWSLGLAGQPLSWTSITVPAGTTTTPVTTLQPGTAFILGDSRAAGLNVLGSSTQSFAQSFARAVARAFQCETMSHVFPGVGWQVAAGTAGQGCPIYTPGNAGQSAYNQLNGSFARTFPSGLKYVFVLGMGTNDALRSITQAEITASVSGFNTAIRALIPASCPIIHVPCWTVGSQSNMNTAQLVTATQAGVANYVASSGDQLCLCAPIMLTAWELAQSYNAGTGGSSGTASYWTPDGIHTYSWVDEQLAAQIVQVIQAALLPPAPPIRWGGGFAA